MILNLVAGVVHHCCYISYLGQGMGLGWIGQGRILPPYIQQPLFSIITYQLLHNVMKIQNFSQLFDWTITDYNFEYPNGFAQKRLFSERIYKILSPRSMYGVLQIFSTLQLSSTFWNVSCISNTLLPDR